MIILMNNHQEITDIIEKLNHHYLASINLANNNLHSSLDRSVNRFRQVEKSMLDKLAPFESYRRETDAGQSGNRVTPFASHEVMYQANLSLVTFLKHKLAAIENDDIRSFLSYWVAALQMENDEMAKYLPVSSV